MSAITAVQYTRTIPELIDASNHTLLGQYQSYFIQSQKAQLAHFCVKQSWRNTAFILAWEKRSVSPAMKVCPGPIGVTITFI